MEENSLGLQQSRNQEILWGTTAQRPGNPKKGDMYSNETTRSLDLCFTDGTWTALLNMKAPYTMTPSSLYSVGADIAAYAFAAPASATWVTANRAIYIPFWLPEAVTLTQIFWYNGAVVAGNTDCGVYNSAGVKQISTGSTAMSGANAIQSVNVADTALAAGSYYLALNNDTTTDAFFCWTSTAAQSVAMGLAQETSAFPLPSSATLATIATPRLPICGFTVRSFV